MENPDEFVKEGFFLLVGDFGALVFGQGGGDGGDSVHGGEFVLEVLAEVFAENAADAVSRRGASDVFFGDDDSESGSSAFLAEAVCFDPGPLNLAPAPGGESEVFALCEEAVCRQGSGGGGGVGVGVGARVGVGAGVGVMRKAERALCGAGRSEWRARVGTPCGRGIHGRACGGSLRAGKCVS